MSYLRLILISILSIAVRIVKLTILYYDATYVILCVGVPGARDSDNRIIVSTVL